MKFAKFAILIAGVLGLVSFFLPALKGNGTSFSAMQIVKGVEEIATGVHDVAEQTGDDQAKAFSGGWLHTGDVGRFDEDGFLYIVDRKKDMIVTGGFNVFPRELEDVISAHPSVAMVQVIGVPDERWGESVKAVVVLKPGVAPSDELAYELKNKVKEAAHG